MLTIGEFSRVTQLSIKALRLYHEKGILVPDAVDPSSRYRYYRGSAVERAKIIRTLKELGFSLDEMADIIQSCSDDRQLIDRVQQKLQTIDASIRHMQQTKRNLQQFMDAAASPEPLLPPQIVYEEIPDMQVCGMRFYGKYSDIGAKIGLLFRSCGRVAASGPFSLYYDGEYKEEGADIEIAVEAKKDPHAEGILFRTLPGGKAITLLHIGPYDELGRSYMRVFEHAREQKLEIVMPTREHYQRGPGMIFRGNPKKYITKLILLYQPTI